MIKALINIYSFEELSNEAKKKAIEDHRFFLLSEMYLEDYEDREEKIIENAKKRGHR